MQFGENTFLELKYQKKEKLNPLEMLCKKFFDKLLT